MKNILLRTLSGLIYIALIVAGILLGKWTFLALTLAFVIAGKSEFYRMCNVDRRRTSKVASAIDLVASCMLVISLWYSCFFGSYILFAYYGVVLMVRFVLQLYSTHSQPMESLAFSLLGQVYIALPVALSVLIFSYSPHMVLVMCVLIWVNDTGAFLVGSSLGRHRLFERISPKKSWEGFWGGLVLTVAVSVLITVFTDDIPLTPWMAAGWGLLVVAAATWGDLIESMFKRSIHIKDSGVIIPGHGGMLDRIDSLLLVIPATVCFIILFLI